MCRMFFYREQKAVFVMAALAIWFGVLGQVGPWLPGNAIVHSKQLAVNVNGSLITGRWQRENGHWTFQKVAGIKRTARRKATLHKQALRRLAFHKAQAALQANALSATSGAKLVARTATKIRPVSAMALASRRPAPAITASLPVTSQKDQAIRAAHRLVRARLAAEIGRWARIGESREWQKNSKEAKVSALPKELHGRDRGTAGARWRRRNGIWFFDVKAHKEQLISI